MDSNITMDYLETSVDWETGEIDLKVKKKYFNNAQLYKLRKTLNSEINGKSMQKRQELQDKYGFQVFESNPTTNFSVKIGDMTFTLEVSNHTVATSNKGAYDEIYGAKRKLYHPEGEEEDTIYITASKTRIIDIYNNLKAGKKLDRRGNIIN